jgi:23S rRNA maturation mini-RNase III
VFASDNGCKTQCEVYEYVIKSKTLIATLKEGDQLHRTIVKDVSRKKFNEIAEELLEKYGHYFEIITMNTMRARRKRKREKKD